MPTIDSCVATSAAFSDRSHTIHHSLSRIGMTLIGRALAASAAVLMLGAAACGSDSSTGTTSAPTPVLGLAATAKSTTSVDLTFNSAAGDASYDIARAEGTGAFTAA